MFPRFRSLTYDGSTPCSFVHAPRGMLGTSHHMLLVVSRTSNTLSYDDVRAVYSISERVPRRHDMVHVFPCTCLSRSSCLGRGVRQRAVHHCFFTASDLANLNKRNHALLAFTPHAGWPEMSYTRSTALYPLRSPGGVYRRGRVPSVRNVPFVRAHALGSAGPRIHHPCEFWHPVPQSA